MKRLILFFVLFASCNNDPEIIDIYIVKNTTIYNSEIIIYHNIGKDTIILKKLAAIEIEKSDFRTVANFKKSDSISINFDGNKRLVYKNSNNCFNKSFYCPTSFDCTKGMIEFERNCTFIIDDIEYQKAK